MKSREEVYAFLKTLEGKRFMKSELEKKCQFFLGTTNKFEDSTDPDNKEADYSWVFTNGDCDSIHNFIDIEIFYLKARQRNSILVVEADLLMYEE